MRLSYNLRPLKAHHALRGDRDALDQDLCVSERESERGKSELITSERERDGGGGIERTTRDRQRQAETERERAGSRVCPSSAWNADCGGTANDEQYSVLPKHRPNYIGERLKLEGETENMGICTEERRHDSRGGLMATPCTKSLGCESGGHKHAGDEGRRPCWKFAAS